MRRLVLTAVFLGFAGASARADGVPANSDAQVVLGEAKYQIGVLSERVMTCAVQVGRDNQEVSRLTAEIAAAKAEIEKLKPAAKPAPTPAPAPADPPEPPK